MMKAMKEKSARKRLTSRRKVARRAARKKVKTRVGGKTAGAPKKQVREKSQSVHSLAFALEEPGARSGAQSGDLQGLSSVGCADSESVDELLEEGNAFEAEVVKGVEDAEQADEKEVHTHEVPQDDVPSEYLGKSSE